MGEKEVRSARLAVLVLAMGAIALLTSAATLAGPDAALHAVAAWLLAVIAVVLLARRASLRTAIASGLAVGAVVFLRRLVLVATAVDADPVELEYMAFRGLILFSGAATIGLGSRLGLGLGVTGLVAAIGAVVLPGGVVAADVGTAGRLALYTGVGIVMFRLLSMTLADARARVDSATETAELAFIDDLTGLPNRRQMSLHLRASLARAVEGGGPDAVIMFDLDCFKDVNDTMGHDVGDQVLRRVTRTVAAGMRDGDVLGRWGGEEFLVLLSDAGAAEAARIADRCRRLLAVDDAEPPMTASFGVAEVLPGDAVTDLLRRVDLALYGAKQRGRDRVEVAAPATR